MRKRLENKNLGVIVLAAGKGTRMESEVNKVLHPVAGRPMLAYVLETALKLAPTRLVTVVGHQGEQVRKAFRSFRQVRWVRQKEMRGTGDAVRCCAPAFRGFTGDVLVLYGDIPGIRIETLRRLVMVHRASHPAITLLTAELDEPTGYGRIVLEPDGGVARIVEEVDATPEEKEIVEINTGIGIYDGKLLFSAVQDLRPINRQKELYLTDVVALARKAKKGVGRFPLREPYEAFGVNDREGLYEVSRIFFDEQAKSLLESGVTLEDPASSMIDPGCHIGRDSILGANVRIRGAARVGAHSRLGTGVEIRQSEVGDGVILERNVELRRAKIGEETWIGANTRLGGGEG